MESAKYHQAWDFHPYHIKSMFMFQNSSFFISCHILLLINLAEDLEIIHKLACVHQITYFQIQKTKKIQIIINKNLIIHENHDHDFFLFKWLRSTSHIFLSEKLDFFQNIENSLNFKTSVCKWLLSYYILERKFIS
jgi:hypothetical protein